MKHIAPWRLSREEIVSLSPVELHRNPTLAELLAAAPVDESEADDVNDSAQCPVAPGVSRPSTRDLKDRAM